MGAGGKNGSKESGFWASLPARYAAKGYVCISVNYRLTGDGGGFPACVHDVKNAVRWFRANSKELGLDPKRIGAYGNSAGAHLVSMLGLVKKEAGLEGQGTHLEQSFSCSGCLCLSHSLQFPQVEKSVVSQPGTTCRRSRNPPCSSFKSISGHLCGRGCPTVPPGSC